MAYPQLTHRRDHSDGTSKPIRNASRAPIRHHRERTGDAPPEKPLAFYRALNAAIRARLAAERIAEPGAPSTTEWSGRAAALSQDRGERAVAFF